MRSIEYTVQKIIAKIHLGNIRYNAEQFAALTGTRLCAVVKANAYGHGAEEVVNALSGVADHFAVALIEEGVAIRAAACGKDILVFTPPTDEEEGYLLAANGFVATVDGLYTAKLLSKVCAKYRLPLQVHLKVNTGMNRYGMNGSMLGRVCKFLQRDPYIRVTGIYSHLYAHTRAVAEEQRTLFMRMLDICRRYFPSVIAHLGATYGALLGKEYPFDMVRIGIGLYGYSPCETEKISLKKGMSTYTKAVVCRTYSFGSAGYGDVRKGKGTKLTLCRVGYADGSLRRRENGMEDSEKNANDLCMDICIREGRVARGKYLPVLIDAEQTARKTGTIAYEVLCAATRRAECIYDDEITICGE